MSGHSKPAAYTPDMSGVVLTGSVSTPHGPAHSGWVDAYDPATGRVIDTVGIEPNGAYYFSGSATPGDDDVTGKSVKLEFNVDGYESLFYGGTASKRLAPALAVPAYGQAPALANGTVTADGTITGSVKLPAAGANWSATVTIYDAGGGVVDEFIPTDAAGHFSVDVAPGSYYVRADGMTWKNNFVAGYYGGKKAVSLATAKKGIRPGAKLKVGHGSWNRNVATTFTYTWKVGKKTIGHHATLKLTKKVWKKKLKNGKKIKKLTVTVTANDKYGYLVSGSSKQKVVKALAKEQKAADTAVKKAQKQANKVEKKTRH